MYKHLSSPNNPIIKQAVLLKHKARERKNQQRFIAEGLREVQLALVNGYEADTLFFNPDQTPESTVLGLIQKADHAPASIITVSEAVLDKIAYRSGVPNVVAVFKHKTQAPAQQIDFGKPNPLILILEGIEKPGNLGAILRTADAAGIDALFVCEPNFDLYNPNAIRASLGAIFTLPIFEWSSQKTITYLQQANIPVYATYLEAAIPLYECDLKSAAALLLGAEAKGISPLWIQEADQRIIIPMHGQVDSMNVSAAAAIALFEAVRQRL